MSQLVKFQTHNNWKATYKKPMTLTWPKRIDIQIDFRTRTVWDQIVVERILSPHLAATYSGLRIYKAVSTKEHKSSFRTTMPFTSSSAIQEKMPRVEFPSCKKMSRPRNPVEMGGRERRHHLVRLWNALGNEAVLKHNLCTTAFAPP